jgi:small-conductance mechanosensitive channel
MSALPTSISQTIQKYLGLDSVSSDIITSIILFAVVIFIAWVGHTIFTRYVERWCRNTKTSFDDRLLANVKAPIFLLAILIGAGYSFDALTFLSAYRVTADAVFLVASAFVVAFVLTRVFKVLIDWYGEKRKQQDEAVSNHLLFVFNKIIQLIIYIGAFVFILFAFEIDLSGVVVGLGVGGIAIALAVQSTLSDLFSAFSIYFDRPFEIGDFIVVGNYSGTVTKIGIKSTRLQLLQGEELVISNKELTGTSLRNFKKLQKRRIVFSVGVTYDTSSEKLRKIPDLIKQVISGIDSVDFDRAHFSEFGDFSLKFEVVYYVTTGDYLKYMDSQQAINFGIKSAFEKEGIEMAFPTQTVFVKK